MVAVAAVVAVVRAAARAKVVAAAAVVVGTMAVVLVSPLTLCQPSATVLIHSVLKLVLSENTRPSVACGWVGAVIDEKVIFTKASWTDGPTDQWTDGPTDRHTLL